MASVLAEWSVTTWRVSTIRSIQSMAQGVRKRGSGRFRDQLCRRQTRWGREWGRDDQAVQRAGELLPV